MALASRKPLEVRLGMTLVSLKTWLSWPSTLSFLPWLSCLSYLLCLSRIVSLMLVVSLKGVISVKTCISHGLFQLSKRVPLEASASHKTSRVSRLVSRNGFRVSYDMAVVALKILVSPVALVSLVHLMSLNNCI